MKNSKKPQPAIGAKRGRPSKPEGERQVIGARLQPEIYRKVVEASVANRTSIAGEIEKRIVGSFGDDVARPANDLGRRMVNAFEARWMDGAESAPPERWMDDGFAYDGAVIRVFEALLARHPHPSVGHFRILLHAVRSRLEGKLLAIDPDAVQRLPDLDWGHRSPTPDDAVDLPDPARLPTPDTNRKNDES